MRFRQRNSLRIAFAAVVLFGSYFLLFRRSIIAQNEQIFYKIIGGSTNLTLQSETPTKQSFNETEVDFDSGKLYNLAYDEYRGQSIWSGVNEGSRDKYLNVFIVPFSHVDPGWLHTVDEYTDKTNRILNLMSKFLTEHKDMTFIWMETIFFSSWWESINTTVRSDVKSLLQSGQLELASGSWVMTDEAVTHYWASIDNIIEGHQYIRQILGSDFIPETSWSIDPFGHGSTVPYLFKLANIKNFIINRITAYLKVALRSNSALEFKWRQSWDKTGLLDAFTHVLPFGHYDILNNCGPDYLVCCQFDFLRTIKFACSDGAARVITDENVEERASALANQYRASGNLLPHGNVLVLLGDDFRFDEAIEWDLQYFNYKRLIDYINKDASFNMTVRFSTLRDYFNEVENYYAKAKPPKVLTGDFFPYQDVLDMYWTGYYTTRPHHKKVERQLQSLLRAADILSSIIFLKRRPDSNWFLAVFDKLQIARRNLALFQHHDAVTGTCKEHVAKDYLSRLYASIYLCLEVMKASLALLFDNSELNLSYVQGWMPNDRIIDFKLENDSSYVIKLKNGAMRKILIFNPMPYDRVEFVRLITDCYNLEIKNSEGTELAYQVNPFVCLNGSVAMDLFEIVIGIRLGSLAVHAFSIRKSILIRNDLNLAQIYTTSEGLRLSRIIFPRLNESTEEMSNRNFITIHDKDTGYLKEIKSKDGWISANIHFHGYLSSGSGHYIFSPDSQEKNRSILESRNDTKIIIVKGSLSSAVYSIRPDIYHVERLYETNQDSDLFELDIENIVDIEKYDQIELAMRLATSVASEDDTFYSDLNGFQIMRREYLEKLGIEMNYYPIASSLISRNSTSRLAILAGQSHGGTVHSGGLMEIMLDRKLTSDDGKGVSEALTATIPAWSEFRLIWNKDDANAELTGHQPAVHNRLHSLIYRPIIFLADSAETDQLNDIALAKGVTFPLHIHLVNIRALNRDKEFALIIHRLMLQQDEQQSSIFQEKKIQDVINRFLDDLNVRKTLIPCTLSGIPKGTTAQQDWAEIEDLDEMEVRTYCFGST